MLNAEHLIVSSFFFSFVVFCNARLVAYMTRYVACMWLVTLTRASRAIRSRYLTNTDTQG